MANSKLFLVALFGAFLCAGSVRQLPAATDNSKIDIGIGRAPPPGTLGFSLNDTINVGTPGLAPPPGNLVGIKTNNTISVPLPHVPLPAVGLPAANAKTVHYVRAASSDATTDEPKTVINDGLAPPPSTLAIGENGTVIGSTPGLAPPLRNHADIIKTRPFPPESCPKCCCLV